MSQLAEKPPKVQKFEAILILLGAIKYNDQRVHETSKHRNVSLLDCKSKGPHFLKIADRSL